MSPNAFNKDKKIKIKCLLIYCDKVEVIFIFLEMSKFFEKLYHFNFFSVFQNVTNNFKIIIVNLSK